MRMAGLGELHWTVPGGNIPFSNSGNEPDVLGQDRIAILNTNKQVARIEICIYFEDENSIGPYCFEVKAERLCKIKFNDFIDPQAIPLEKDFGVFIKSDVPVVVQFSRLNPKQEELSIMSTIAYSE